jgi:uncharacterized protein YggE
MRVRTLVVVAVMLPAIAIAQDRPPGPPTVDASGTGTRRIPPDRASVMLRIETKSPMSAGEAAVVNAHLVDAVRDTLKKAGLDSSVVTTAYSVGPDVQSDPRGEQRQVGYVARTVLRVSLGRLDQVGRVIDVGLAKGATGVTGVIFEASNMEGARLEALADAATAARRQAEALAKALGGTLGPLISSSTSMVGVAGGDVRYSMALEEMAYTSAARAIPTQLSPREIVVSAVVTTRWQFVPRP